ncbi:MAG: hypothetical protein LH702_06840 [Phormidesmis sp. CAN_BIN44]|nr:hypothetical protein [Phormidesmis sp. CAN_BIN44]
MYNVLFATYETFNLQGDPQRFARSEPRKTVALNVTTSLRTVEAEQCVLALERRF